ncbi:hypothetical protein M1523_00330 [Patescibacteria group bacterium]|nr:hypothetical protein [Patescibacteria group bacterium]MCL5091917.1 hypothetical protein [Patescibacteria group bacterium]
MKKELIVLVLVGAAALLYFQLRSSLLLTKHDRLNVLIYDSAPVAVSVDRVQSIPAIIAFSPNDKLVVPGGYGEYRVGALGRLAQLEKRPVLLRNAFSARLNVFVDRYFYPAAAPIYYGDRGQADHQPLFVKLLTYAGNANLFDRVYLIFLFAQTGVGKTEPLDQASSQNKLWYQKLFRTEQKRVQLIYQHRYLTAGALSDLIEGNGIRVVDISVATGSDNGDCVVTDSQTPFSQTALSLAQFFGCRLRQQKGEVSDIIIYLNKVERDWEINNQ